MTDPLAQICSIAEAAKLLRVSEKRVGVFLAEGRIAAKRLKREYAISRQSVLAFAKVPLPVGPRR